MDVALADVAVERSVPRRPAEVIRTFRAVSTLLERRCPEAITTYIISSTTEPAHLLEVLLMAREARLFRPAEGVSRLDMGLDLSEIEADEQIAAQPRPIADSAHGRHAHGGSCHDRPAQWPPRHESYLDRG